MGRIAQQVREAAAFLATKSRLRPTVALVLGSGLGAFAKELRDPDTVSYQDIPHFPYSTVEGHAGHLILGRYADVPLAVMVGRVHAYEGYTAQEVVFPARVLTSFGAKTLIATNAAGAINTAFKPGDLMIISDQLNLTGLNPMCGTEEKELGPRFIDLTEAYNAKLRSMCDAAGRAIGLNLRQGVYAGLLGPSYETPAEIRMLRTMGADAVGMSTVLEVIAANQMETKVLGISCMTNMAAGILPQKLVHSEVMETGERVRGVFTELLQELIPRLAKLD